MEREDFGSCFCFTGALRVCAGGRFMFLGIDNCFVTSCHEDLVLDTGLVSAVAL